MQGRLFESGWGKGTEEDTERFRQEADEKKRVSVKLTSDTQNRGVWFVNESGVYEVIFTSNKPNAKAFRRWVYVQDTKLAGILSNVLQCPPLRRRLILMEKNNPFELTRNEIISAGQAVAGIRVFIQATKWHFGFERGRQVFLRTMSHALKVAHELLEGVDFTEMDSWELIHRWRRGRLIETFKEKLQNTSTQDSLRNVKWEAMAVAARYASWWQTYDYYCKEELMRRDTKHGVFRFLNLALGEPSSRELAMVKKDLAGVMKKKFVLSECHSPSEHDVEKDSITNEAITIVATRLKNTINSNFDKFSSQLVAVLDGEKSQLSYLPNQVNKQFINIVEQQVSGGKHWNVPDLKHRTEMNWLDAPLNSESGLSMSEAWEQKQRQSDSNPEREVCSGSIKNLLHEIENSDSRLGKVARVYFEADMEDKKRPTQREVADCLEVTDRTVRNHLQKLSVFLEKKYKK